MQLNLKEAERIIGAALSEDIGQGDLTSTLLIGPEVTSTLSFVAREEMTVCGVHLMPLIFRKVNPELRCHLNTQEAEKVPANTTMLTVSGKVRPILMAERVALNLLQRMCAVATYTRRFVEAVEGTEAVILDTRKTMPGLRELDKFAVRVGGGRNHRMRLDDGILIKDNHIAFCGSVKEAVKRSKEGATALTRVEVECETLEQVMEALEAGADMIMLDNMDTATMKKICEVMHGKIPIEASGGITLENVRDVAETGVQFISVGSITHSVPSVDIGLDYEPVSASEDTLNFSKAS